MEVNDSSKKQSQDVAVEKIDGVVKDVETNANKEEAALNKAEDLAQKVKQAEKIGDGQQEPEKKANHRTELDPNPENNGEQGKDVKNGEAGLTTEVGAHQKSTPVAKENTGENSAKLQNEASANETKEQMLSENCDKRTSSNAGLDQSVEPDTEKKVKLD